jgi:hypothetical protein
VREEEGTSKSLKPWPSWLLKPAAIFSKKVKGSTNSAERDQEGGGGGSREG